MDIGLMIPIGILSMVVGAIIIGVFMVIVSEFKHIARGLRWRTIFIIFGISFASITIGNLIISFNAPDLRFGYVSELIAIIDKVI